jgi:hypothetical protein
MKAPNRLALLTLALLLPALPAAAGKHEVRRSIEAAPAGLVEIELFDGSVTVAGWDKPAVEVTAILDRAGDEIDFERSGSSLSVEVESRHPGISRARLSINVPRGSSLRIEVMSAAVEVREVDGDIDIEAVNGDIRIAGKPAKVRANTVTGQLSLATTRTDSVDLETVSGSLEAEGEVRYIDTSTVAGSQRLRLRGIARGKFETVSGGLDAEIHPATGGRFDLSSFSGDVSLAVPANVSGRFELESHTGRVRSSLAKPGEHRREDAELEFQLGGGDALFRLESHSGGIEVKPLP